MNPTPRVSAQFYLGLSPLIYYDLQPTHKQSSSTVFDRIRCNSATNMPKAKAYEVAQNRSRGSVRALIHRVGASLTFSASTTLGAVKDCHRYASSIQASRARFFALWPGLECILRDSKFVLLFARGFFLPHDVMDAWISSYSNEWVLQRLLGI